MDSEINSTTTCSNLDVLDVSNENNEISSILYQAIKDKRFDVIKLLLEDKTLVNASIQTSGPLAGYTPLHVACIEEGDDWELYHFTKILIEKYDPEINITAEDGIQPIHLACLSGDHNITRALLEAGANVEAEISQNMFSKYVKDKVWCGDFGDKMTLVTFTILYDHFDTALVLINHHANLNIRGCTNKTLLMYALERDEYLGEIIARFMKNNEEYLNARDDDGYSAVHYLLHPKKYGDFRYDGEQLFFDNGRQNCIFYLSESSTQIYAMINEDPDTLLLNMAAYRSSATILKQTLPYYENIKNSKALYFATLPFERSQESFRLDPVENEQNQWVLLDLYRKESLKLILQDLINRLTFGLPVPEDEKNLLDKLLATDENIREIVNNYQQNFINGRLKNSLIKYGNESMTYYDFILHCIDDKKLNSLLRNNIFWKAYLHFNSNNDDDYYFNKFCSIRIKRATDRVKLLEKLNTIEELGNVIPLSYKCTLDMVEFLNNDDLKTFINSFFTTLSNY